MNNILNPQRLVGNYFTCDGDQILLNINAASSEASDLGTAVQKAMSMEFGWWRSGYNVWIVARIQGGEWHRFVMCPLRDYWSYCTPARIGICITDQATNEILGSCEFAMDMESARSLQSDLSIVYENAIWSQPDRVLADFADFGRLTADGHMARIRHYHGVSVFD